MKRDEQEFSRSRDEAAHVDTPACERNAEMVAYLYEEASREERRSFELHMQDCAACREELTAFRGVRRAVSAWRAEALSVTPSLASPASAGIADANVGVTDAGVRLASASREPSALAALREFFALSPAWLRACVAASALAVFALAALTLARAELSWGEEGFAVRLGATERVVERRVEVPAPTEGFTREQVDEIANARVERALAEYRAKADAESEGRVVNASGDKGSGAERAGTRLESPARGAKRRGR
ncbi:MAG TPA: zf-HC2 domain-containing protein, partial [Pyrinomonadaceae bacterium]|nr:zf-HC2 domain-containing protein [Pyrinomonadaceae bacterium]